MLSSDDGPEFEVPRWLWRTTYWLIMLLGLVVFVYAILQISVAGKAGASDPSIFARASWILVGIVYAEGCKSGAKWTVEWLFGPLDRERP